MTRSVNLGLLLLDEDRPQSPANTSPSNASSSEDFALTIPSPEPRSSSRPSLAIDVSPLLGTTPTMPSYHGKYYDDNEQTISKRRVVEHAYYGAKNHGLPKDTIDQFAQVIELIDNESDKPQHSIANYAEVFKAKALRYIVIGSIQQEDYQRAFSALKRLMIESSTTISSTQLDHLLQSIFRTIEDQEQVVKGRLLNSGSSDDSENYPLSASWRQFVKCALELVLMVKPVESNPELMIWCSLLLLEILIMMLSLTNSTNDVLKLSLTIYNNIIKHLFVTSLNAPSYNSSTIKEKLLLRLFKTWFPMLCKKWRMQQVISLYESPQAQLAIHHRLIGESDDETNIVTSMYGRWKREAKESYCYALTVLERWDEARALLVELPHDDGEKQVEEGALFLKRARRLVRVHDKTEELIETIQREVTKEKEQDENEKKREETQAKEPTKKKSLPMMKVELAKEKEEAILILRLVQNRLDELDLSIKFSISIDEGSIYCLSFKN